MPSNAFAALGEQRYGPQYLHNVAYLSGDGRWGRMAEGWMQVLCQERSIGTAVGSTSCVEDPEAVAAMAEAGVDISEMEALELEALDPEDFDITVLLTQKG